MKNLLKAIYTKNTLKVDELANTKQNINILDEDGRTILMHAILDSEPSNDFIISLIKKGVDVNIQDGEQKWSALHFAAREQNEVVVAALLNAGANVDSIDVFGNTPLWRAVMGYSSNLDSINCLLHNGANPKKKNDSGVSPIGLAENKGEDELVSLLEKFCDEK